MPHKKRILLSRTDAIGDVLLTLPLAGILKQNRDCEIFFLCQEYTKPIVQQCQFVDQVIVWDEIKKLKKNNAIDFINQLNIDAIIHVFPKKEIAELMAKTNIKKRVGTSRRWYHWFYCNYKISNSRKNSHLHEAQLNTKLLQIFNLDQLKTIAELNQFSGFKVEQTEATFQKYLHETKLNLIIHPTSNKSARDYTIEQYHDLIVQLDENKFNIIITGTTKDQSFTKELLKKHQKVVDAVGHFNLLELIKLIHVCDALIACSTGPLHIASMLNKFTIGLYPPIKPIGPTRWKPIGDNTKVLSYQGKCPQTCFKNQRCFCMEQIKTTEIIKLLNQHIKS